MNQAGHLGQLHQVSQRCLLIQVVHCPRVDPGLLGGHLDQEDQQTLAPLVCHLFQADLKDQALPSDLLSQGTQWGQCPHLVRLVLGGQKIQVLHPLPVYIQIRFSSHNCNYMCFVMSTHRCASKAWQAR